MLPSPVEYRLAAADARRLRNAEGPPSVVRALAIVVILSSILAIFLNIGRRSQSPHWIAVTQPIFFAWLIVSNVRLLFRRRISYEIGDSWMLHFDEDAIRLTCGPVASSMTGKRIALRSIRSVSLASERLFIVVTGAPHLEVPRSALVDGGDAVMRYFRERLVGERMLVPSGERMTIRNTRDFNRRATTHV